MTLKQGVGYSKHGKCQTESPTSRRTSAQASMNQFNGSNLNQFFPSDFRVRKFLLGKTHFPFDRIDISEEMGTSVFLVTILKICLWLWFFLQIGVLCYVSCGFVFILYLSCTDRANIVWLSCRICVQMMYECWRLRFAIANVWKWMCGVKNESFVLFAQYFVITV